jgi:HSP20 family protein
MADTRTNRSETEKQTGQGVARQDQGIQRHRPAFGGPFDWMERMSDQMDRIFGDFGFGTPRRSWLTRGAFGPGREGLWSPRVEAFQKGDRFIVRAELPGLKREDVNVELTNDAVSITGERREEREENREGYYHSEREYGHFQRTIPLPEGVISESANATFRDGVLEVTMQAAPAEANRGRKLEIKGE